MYVCVRHTYTQKKNIHLMAQEFDEIISSSRSGSLLWPKIMCFLLFVFFFCTLLNIQEQAPSSLQKWIIAAVYIYVVQCVLFIIHTCICTRITRHSALCTWPADTATVATFFLLFSAKLWEYGQQIKNFQINTHILPAACAHRALWRSPNGILMSI